MYFYTIEVSYQRFLSLLESLNMGRINIFEYYENSLNSVWLAMKELKYEYMLIERAFFHMMPLSKMK